MSNSTISTVPIAEMPDTMVANITLRFPEMELLGAVPVHRGDDPQRWTGKADIEQETEAWVAAWRASVAVWYEDDGWKCDATIALNGDAQELASLTVAPSDACDACGCSSFSFFGTFAVPCDCDDCKDLSEPARRECQIDMSLLDGNVVRCP